MTIDIVGRSDEAPAPAGPYSQSRRRGDIVACAGQAG
ncbi:MAG: reactive intermediate/imine deaminase, partial [Microbacterium sp.]